MQKMVLLVVACPIDMGMEHLYGFVPFYCSWFGKLIYKKRYLMSDRVFCTDISFLLLYCIKELFFCTALQKEDNPQTR